MINDDQKKFLLTEYNIDIDKYDEKSLHELLSKIIDRNDKMIDINEEKLKILIEINNDINNYLSRGNK